MALAYGSRSAIIHHVLALTLRRAPRRPTSLSHRGLASANTAVVEGEPVSYDDQWMFPYDDIVQDVPRFKHKTAAQVRSREKRSESTPIAGPSSPINSTTWKNGSEDLKIGPLNQAQEVVAAPDETQATFSVAPKSGVHPLDPKTSDTHIPPLQLLLSLTSLDKQYVVTRAVDRYLRSVLPLPTSITRLQSLQRDLRLVLRSFYPGPSSGYWMSRGEFFHACVQHVAQVYVEVIERLAKTNALEIDARSLGSLDPVLISLALCPNPQIKLAKGKLPELVLTLPKVVETMIRSGIRLSEFQFEMLFHYFARNQVTRRQLRKSKSEPLHFRKTMSTEEFSEILWRWETLQSLRKLVRPALGNLPVTDALEADAIRIGATLSQQVGTGPYPLELADSIQAGRLYWMNESNDLQQRLRQTVDGLETRLKMARSCQDPRDSLVRASRQEAALLCSMIPLSPAPRHFTRRGTMSSYEDPLHWLCFILGMRGNDLTSTEPCPNLLILQTSIMRMRNYLYRSRQIDALVQLVRLLGPRDPRDSQVIPAPPLDGETMISLLSAARTSQQFCRLFIPLLRLPTPTDPPDVLRSRSTLRMLGFFARDADRRGHVPDLRNPLDQAALAVVRDHGWVGLWFQTLDKWRVGGSLEAHLARLEGRKRDRRLRIRGSSSREDTPTRPFRALPKSLSQKGRYHPHLHGD